MLNDRRRTRLRALPEAATSREGVSVDELLAESGARKPRVLESTGWGPCVMLAGCDLENDD